MANNKIIVGSRAFFRGMDGFKPSDEDYVVLMEMHNQRFKNQMQVRMGDKCIFFWLEKSKEEMLDYLLKSNDPLQVGKFLVPVFAERLSITIDDLRQLQPMVDKLDAKHQYLRTIYEAYLANGSFTLTDEQRAAAFEVYRAARPDKTDKPAE